MTKFRGFIAIEIDSFPKIIEFENEIKRSGAYVKLVEPQNSHITLEFQGDTDENSMDKIEAILKESVKEIEPFEIGDTLKDSQDNDVLIESIEWQQAKLITYNLKVEKYQKSVKIINQHRKL